MTGMFHHAWHTLILDRWDSNSARVCDSAQGPYWSQQCPAPGADPATSEHVWASLSACGLHKPHTDLGKEFISHRNNQSRRPVAIHTGQAATEGIKETGKVGPQGRDTASSASSPFSFWCCCGLWPAAPESSWPLLTILCWLGRCAQMWRANSHRVCILPSVLRVSHAEGQRFLFLNYPNRIFTNHPHGLFLSSGLGPPMEMSRIHRQMLSITQGRWGDLIVSGVTLGSQENKCAEEKGIPWWGTDDLDSGILKTKPCLRQTSSGSFCKKLWGFTDDTMKLRPERPWDETWGYQEQSACHLAPCEHRY